MKYELQNIIQGKSGTGQTNIIRQITDYLRAGKEAGSGHEAEEYTKHQEEKRLGDFITENHFSYPELINEYNKIDEGAEQKVYYYPDKGIVIKINDAIYFKYWKII